MAASYVKVGVAAVLLAGSAAPALSAKLQVKKTETVDYDCENGQRATAAYYTLSDGSLSFVKLALDGQAPVTLPAVVSGSGTRYTDLHQIDWWTKGGSASLSMNASDDNAPRTNCEISGD